MLKRIFLCLGCLVFLSSISFAAWTEYSRVTTGMEVSLSTVTLRVRVLIDDPNSVNGTVRYSSSTLYGFINDAHKLLAINTGVLTTWATQTLTVGVTEYTLPTNLMYIERVTLDLNDGDGEYFIKQKTMWGMDLSNKFWAAQASTPTAFYLYNRNIGLYPGPISGNCTLKLYYVKQPDTLDAETDLIFDGMKLIEPYWHVLAEAVAYQILSLEGRAEAAKYETSFGAVQMAILHLLKNNPTYLPSGIMENKP